MRALLYALARFLGDVRAVRKGRIAERLWNRTIGRIAARLLGRTWR